MKQKPRRSASHRTKKVVQGSSAGRQFTPRAGIGMVREGSDGPEMTIEWIRRRIDEPEPTPMSLDPYQRHNLIVLLQAILESGIGWPIDTGDWSRSTRDMALDQLVSEEEIKAYQASGQRWDMWMRKHIRGNAKVDEVIKWFKERGKPKIADRQSPKRRRSATAKY